MQGVRCVYMDLTWHCVCVWHMGVSSQDTVCGHLIRQRSTFLYPKLCPHDRYPMCLHVLVCPHDRYPVCLHVLVCVHPSVLLAC